MKSNDYFNIYIYYIKTLYILQVQLQNITKSGFLTSSKSKVLVIHPGHPLKNKKL